jgi:AbrB family looped-hinge helix DNA binding protein
MAFATVTSKGQTMIPKDVRAAANLKPGDRIHFTSLAKLLPCKRSQNSIVAPVASNPSRSSLLFTRVETY